jgi:hypothetical protein
MSFPAGKGHSSTPDRSWAPGRVRPLSSGGGRQATSSCLRFPPSRSASLHHVGIPLAGTHSDGTPLRQSLLGVTVFVQSTDVRVQNPAARPMV